MLTTIPEISKAGRYSRSTDDRERNRNNAAAPMVATVIEKMLSVMLYWKTVKSGIAAARTEISGTCQTSFRVQEPRKIRQTCQLNDSTEL